MSQSRAEETTSSTSSTTEQHNEPKFELKLHIKGNLSEVIAGLLETVEELKSMQLKIARLSQIIEFMHFLGHVMQENDMEESDKFTQGADENNDKATCNNEESDEESAALSRFFGIFAEKATQTETPSSDEENEPENDSDTEKNSDSETDNDNTATQSPKLH